MFVQSRFVLFQEMCFLKCLTTQEYVDDSSITGKIIPFGPKFGPKKINLNAKAITTKSNFANFAEILREAKKQRNS
jgi:hypothetical protein